MTNILIRGVSEAALRNVDEQAEAQGLSRNEFLRRKFEFDFVPRPTTEITFEDWRQFADAFPDLGNDEVMDRAWG